MMRCPKCRVDYTGYQKKCPLCQTPLDGAPTEAVFPHSALAAPRAVALMVLTFASAAGIAALAFLMFFTDIPNRPLLLGVVALAVNYLFLRNILRRSTGFVRATSRYVFVLVAIALAWYFLTGFEPAVTIALPVVCLCSLVFDGVMLAALQSRFLSEYAKYPIMDIACGLIPLLLMVTGLAPKNPLAVICAFVGVVLGIAIFAFMRRTLTHELSKLFNLGG